MLECQPLFDSSDMTITEWVQIAQTIEVEGGSVGGAMRHGRGRKAGLDWKVGLQHGGGLRCRRGWNMGRTGIWEGWGVGGAECGWDWRTGQAPCRSTGQVNNWACGRV